MMKNICKKFLLLLMLSLLRVDVLCMENGANENINILQKEEKKEEKNEEEKKEENGEEEHVEEREDQNNEQLEQKENNNEENGEEEYEEIEQEQEIKDQDLNGNEEEQYEQNIEQIQNNKEEQNNENEQNNNEEDINNNNNIIKEKVYDDNEYIYANEKKKINLYDEQNLNFVSENDRFTPLSKKPVWDINKNAGDSRERVIDFLKQEERGKKFGKDNKKTLEFLTIIKDINDAFKKKEKEEEGAKIISKFRKARMNNKLINDQQFEEENINENDDVNTIQEVNGILNERIKNIPELRKLKDEQRKKDLNCAMNSYHELCQAVKSKEKEIEKEKERYEKILKKTEEIREKQRKIIEKVEKSEEYLGLKKIIEENKQKLEKIKQEKNQLIERKQPEKVEQKEDIEEQSEYKDIIKEYKDRINAFEDFNMNFLDNDQNKKEQEEIKNSNIPISEKSKNIPVLEDQKNQNEKEQDKIALLQKKLQDEGRGGKKIFSLGELEEQRKQIEEKENELKRLNMDLAKVENEINRIKPEELEKQDEGMAQSKPYIPEKLISLENQRIQIEEKQREIKKKINLARLDEQEKQIEKDIEECNKKLSELCEKAFVADLKKENDEEMQLCLKEIIEKQDKLEGKKEKLDACLKEAEKKIMALSPSSNEVGLAFGNIKGRRKKEKEEERKMIEQQLKEKKMNNLQKDLAIKEIEEKGKEDEVMIEKIEKNLKGMVNEKQKNYVNERLVEELEGNIKVIDKYMKLDTDENKNQKLKTWKPKLKNKKSDEKMESGRNEYIDSSAVKMIEMVESTFVKENYQKKMMLDDIKYLMSYKKKENIGKEEKKAISLLCGNIENQWKEMKKEYNNKQKGNILNKEIKKGMVFEDQQPLNKKKNNTERICTTIDEKIEEEGRVLKGQQLEDQQSSKDEFLEKLHRLEYFIEIYEEKGKSRPEEIVENIKEEEKEEGENEEIKEVNKEKLMGTNIISTNNESKKDIVSNNININTNFDINTSSNQLKNNVEGIPNIDINQQEENNKIITNSNNIFNKEKGNEVMIDSKPINIDIVKELKIKKDNIEEKEEKENINKSKRSARGIIDQGELFDKEEKEILLKFGNWHFDENDKIVYGEDECSEQINREQKDNQKNDDKPLRGLINSPEYDIIKNRILEAKVEVKKEQNEENEEDKIKILKPNIITPEDKEKINSHTNTSDKKFNRGQKGEIEINDSKLEEINTDLENIKKNSNNEGIIINQKQQYNAKRFFEEKLQLTKRATLKEKYDLSKEMFYIYRGLIREKYHDLFKDEDNCIKKDKNVVGKEERYKNIINTCNKELSNISHLILLRGFGRFAISFLFSTINSIMQFERKDVIGPYFSIYTLSLGKIVQPSFFGKNIYIDISLSILSLLIFSAVDFKIDKIGDCYLSKYKITSPLCKFLSLIKYTTNAFNININFFVNKDFYMSFNIMSIFDSIISWYWFYKFEEKFQKDIIEKCEGRINSIEEGRKAVYKTQEYKILETMLNTQEQRIIKCHKWNFFRRMQVFAWVEEERENEEIERGIKERQIQEKDLNINNDINENNIDNNIDNNINENINNDNNENNINNGNRLVFSNSDFENMQ